MPVTPAVSCIIPVLNEEKHLEAAVLSVLGQEYPGVIEVILVLGPSTDGTADVVARLLDANPGIRVVDNPHGSIPVGLNRGIAAASHEIVVRADAHSELPRSYARHAVEALYDTGAVNVGGRMVASGRTPFERAVAWAYNHRAGLGGAVYHNGGRSGPAESVYLGVFRRDAVIAAGGFDERLNRGEDWALNHRLRESGGLVWFASHLAVTYRPRSGFPALARQFTASGRWRAELVRRHGFRNGMRYFVPPLLLVALVAGLALAAVALAIAPHRALVGSVLFVASVTPLAVYAIWIGLTLATARGLSARDRALLGAVVPTMHLSWAAGFVVGLTAAASMGASFTGRPLERAVVPDAG